MKQKNTFAGCILFINVAVAGTLSPTQQPSALTESRCSYSQSQTAEILNETWGVYGSIFSGGNHNHYLESAGGTTDLYRLLNGKLDARLRDENSEPSQEAANTGINPAYGSYDWVLDEVVSSDRAALWERLVDVDIRTSTKFEIPPWNGNGKNTEVGIAYLRWIDAAIKTSRAPWNIYTQFTDAQRDLWTNTLKPQYANILSAYTESGNALDWFIIASEAAFPNDIDPALRLHYESLRSSVATCTATTAEYAAWAIATTKFERDELTNLQKEQLPKYMLEWQVTSISKQIAASISTQEDLNRAVNKLRELSENVGEFNKLIPALYLTYLSGTPTDMRVLLDFDPLKSTPFSVLHLINLFDALDSSALERLYLADVNSPRFKLERLLAAKHFREGNYGKSLQYINLILDNVDMTWDFDARRMLKGNLPIEVRTSALILAIDGISDWASYHYICDRCSSRVKDAPARWLGTVEATARRQHLFDLLLGTPQVLAGTYSMSGYYQDARFDRAKNSFRPELVEDAVWVGGLHKPDLSKLLGPVTPAALPRVIDLAVDHIIDWAKNRIDIDNSPLSRTKRKIFNLNNVIPYAERNGVTASEIVNALESVVYASRSNSMKGTPHPAQEAHRIVTLRFPTQRTLKYWHEYTEDRWGIYLIEQ